MPHPVKPLFLQVLFPPPRIVPSPTPFPSLFSRNAHYGEAKQSAPKEIALINRCFGSDLITPASISSRPHLRDTSSVSQRPHHVTPPPSLSPLGGQASALLSSCQQSFAFRPAAGSNWPNSLSSRFSPPSRTAEPPPAGTPSRCDTHGPPGHRCLQPTRATLAISEVFFTNYHIDPTQFSISSCLATQEVKKPGEVKLALFEAGDTFRALTGA